MVGRTSIGRTPGAGRGRRPKLSPGEVASTPPSLNRQREPNGSAPAQEEGLRPPPPPLSPPVPHRTPPSVPVGLPAKAQARRGYGHAAKPEPKSVQR